MLSPHVLKPPTHIKGALSRVMLAHVRFGLVSVTGFSRAWFVQNGCIHTVKCLKTQDFLRAKEGKIASAIPVYRAMGRGEGSAFLLALAHVRISIACPI